MRVHVLTPRMTPEQADLLEMYLQAVPGIRKAAVHERTMNVVIFFREGMRSSVTSALSAFSYESADVTLPDHTGRMIRRDYENKFFNLIARRIIMRAFIPAPLGALITICRSFSFILKGIRTLAARRIDVSVLDAASVSAAILHGDYGTAGSVMFLLDVGGLLEEWTRKKSIDDLARSMYLNTDQVWLHSGDSEILVPASEIRPGSHIIVRTGNVIPFDGVVFSGEASVNQSSMTGESLPVLKAKDGYVYA